MTERDLAPSALAQVPEVQALFKECDDLADVCCVDYANDGSTWNYCGLLEVIEQVRDAVLSAEKSRLLGMVPESVIEEAVTKWVEMGDTDLCEEAGEEGHGSPMTCSGCARLTIRNLLPLLLAPEVAKREAAEWNAVKSAERQVAAEAERDRLKGALEKYGMHGASCATGYSAVPCDCGLDAALAGGET